MVGFSGCGGPRRSRSDGNALSSPVRPWRYNSGHEPPEAPPAVRSANVICVDNCLRESEARVIVFPVAESSPRLSWRRRERDGVWVERLATQPEVEVVFFIWIRRKSLKSPELDE